MPQEAKNVWVRVQNAAAVSFSSVRISL